MTGANLGEHGLPFGVTREEQQKVDEQAGKIAVEGAAFLVPELRGVKALSIGHGAASCLLPPPDSPRARSIKCIAGVDARIRINVSEAAKTS